MNISRTMVAVLACGLATQVHAATETVLHSFTGGKKGSYPNGLIAVGSTFYGTTTQGGTGKCPDAKGCGTVFSLSPKGKLKILYSFKGGSDGAAPGSLINVDGTFYGTTGAGGTTNLGTVYSLTPSGTETVLHTFQGGSDGSYPVGLTYVGGTFYGTTNQGGGGTGEPCSTYGCGTIFSLTPAGVEQVLFAFQGGTSGAWPSDALLDVGGTLYGVTKSGGISSTACGNGVNLGCGTLYSYVPGSSLTQLYSFQPNGSDGTDPIGNLTILDSTLYGTTYQGGTTGNGTVFSYTPGGTESVVYSFQGGADASAPDGSLISEGGTLYGTTSVGGSTVNCQGQTGCGAFFSVTPAGVETVLYAFQPTNDGNFPDSAIVNVGSVFYGTTSEGGGPKCLGGCGTAFSITP